MFKIITDIFPYYNSWVLNYIEIFIVVLEEFRCRFQFPFEVFILPLIYSLEVLFSKTHKGKLGQIIINFDYVSIWLVCVITLIGAKCVFM